MPASRGRVLNEPDGPTTISGSSSCSFSGWNWKEHLDEETECSQESRQQSAWSGQDRTSGVEETNYVDCKYQMSLLGIRTFSLHRAEVGFETLHTV